MKHPAEGKINSERLWQHIEMLGRIGQNEDGSVTRFPFTGEDKAAAELIGRWMKDAGLTVKTDAAGNLIGCLEVPEEKNASVVLTGSHYDTVLCGGRFDGTLGVLGAIEAVQIGRAHV